MGRAGASHLDVDAVVIGAGPAGLAAARSLQRRGLTYRQFEKGSMVGGLWRIDNDNGAAAAYRSLHLNSSRLRTQFPSFPMPDHWPDYPSHELVARYFQAFADDHGLTEHITFNSAVTAVRPLPPTAPARRAIGRAAGRADRAESDGDAGGSTGGSAEPLPGAHGWEVTTSTGERVTAGAVLVANGHHAVPREPELAGHFDGVRFHAHSYTDPEVFAGQRVLVIGVGNSGMDIACDAARVADHVLLSTRHGVHVLPKYAFGRPIDHLSLPASAYLPFPVERRLYEVITRLAVGRPEDRGLPRPDHRLLEAHPTVSAQLYDLVGHGRIEVVGDVVACEGDKVRFAGDRVEPVDVLVTATGYEVSLPFLDPEVLEVRDNALSLYQRVVPPDRPGLFLVGFVQTVGANIALMEHQAEWIGDLLTGRCVLPERTQMHAWIAADRAALAERYLRSARHTLQVDYWRYIRAIGRERARRRHAVPRALARTLQPVRTLAGRSA